MRHRLKLWALAWIGLSLAVPAPAEPTQDVSAPRPTLVIPRVEQPPQLEDFLEMKANGALGSQLAKVEGFIQRNPTDGAAASQRTEVYLGYDDKLLYVIFLCFDSEPGKVRARLARRESIGADDTVGVILDTFHDQRRAYAFSANPLGIQADALRTEGQGVDMSFDTLWESRGELTEQGYVVWMAIPFKSLRFSTEAEQAWGVIFNRDIPRNNEESYWPHMSSRIQGILNQEATLRGLQGISPGRNVQLIPYGTFRAFRALDFSNPLGPRFTRDLADADAGLDAKVVFKDSLVFDFTFNPDFAQVESDEPQVTVNQRFEVFFPEKRPFFLENANFFRTPINLLFTRRIADPQFGVRLSGKAGPYTIGALVADDQAPGKQVLPGDPLFGHRALFNVVRVSRDIFKQSSVGVIYTGRELENSFNRVGGLDARLKFGQNWVASVQGVTSATRFLDSTRQAGPAYYANVNRSGRQLNFGMNYFDRSPGFLTQSGFVSRTDIRGPDGWFNYRFRPEGKRLISWGPFFFYQRASDHSGLRLDWFSGGEISWEFKGDTFFGFFNGSGRERLRPQDFSGLATSLDFPGNWRSAFGGSSYFQKVNFFANYGWGTGTNFVPAAGPPVLADSRSSFVNITLRPLTPLRIDNTYIFNQLTDRNTDPGAIIFANHILRQKWNWQFTRELSLRVILQYNTVLANPTLTALETSKSFNADFLLTYLLHPGTALYLGYNGNAQNLFLCQGPGMAASDCPSLPAGNTQLIRRRNRFINDAGGFFVKFSYLFRF